MVNVTGVHHLALFICHLFIDGHFRTAHFLYKPNTFQFNWLLKIDKVCPEPIPLYLTDITLPWEWPWNQHDTPDNVLQLNFFDLNNLKDDIDQLGKGFAHYRVFGFYSNDTISNRKLTSTFSVLRQLTKSKILIVNYNTGNMSVYVDYAPNEKSYENPIFVVDNETDFQNINLFDKTFGEYERQKSVMVERLKDSDASTHGIDFQIGLDIHVFWMHFYHLQMNNSLIHMTWVDQNKSPEFRTKQICALQPPDYYKEFFSNYKCSVNKNSLANEYSINLHVQPWSELEVPKTVDKRILYPYHSFKLRAIFVYGSDYKRGVDIFPVSESVKIVAKLLLLLLIVAIITLYVIRRWFSLPGKDFGSCILDCLIPFIGGGNLRMDHRLERWFFSILLVGAFFMMSVFGGDLVDSVVRVLDTKVETFDDVAEINPPIFIDKDLGSVFDEISEKLRLKLDEDIDISYLHFKKFSNTGTSSLVIIYPKSFDLFVTFCRYSERDFDILEEPLGEFLDRYVSTSNQYISERAIAKIDRVSNSMAEHGFYQFFESYFEFLEHRFANVIMKMDDSDDLQTITIEQMKKPIVIFLCLNGLAAIIFIAEILIFRWLKWRNRRVQILPLIERQPKSRQQAMPAAQSSNRRFTAKPKKKNTLRRARKCRSAKF